MGSYWFTTLSGVRRADPDWGEIARYEEPVRRFLGARFPAIPEGDRDDVVQEVLVALKTDLVARYDRARGPFRPYLRTAILNRVRDRLRRRRPRPLDEEAAAAVDVPDDALTAEEAEAIDLEAELSAAIRAFHDRRAAGPGRDLRLVYVFSGALVDGLSNDAIARREGLSADQVKRLLQQARHEVLVELLRPHAAGAAPAERAADLARRWLRAPRERARLLEAEPDRAVAAAVEALLDRVERGLPHLPGLDTDAGRDFLRGVGAILDPGPAAEGA